MKEADEGSTDSGPQRLSNVGTPGVAFNGQSLVSFSNGNRSSPAAEANYLSCTKSPKT